MRKMIKTVGKLVIVSSLMLAAVGCGPEAEQVKSTEATTKATTAATTESVTDSTTAKKTTESNLEAEPVSTPVEEEGEEVKPDDAGRIMIAYTEDGAEVNLTEDSDGTWLTESGDRYYFGDDGVLRSRGNADLFTTNPTQE